MCQDVRATRSARQRPARTPVAARAYTVWLQQIADFSTNARHNTLIHDGTQQRLQAIFNQVARQRGAPRRITVQWTADASQANVRNNEIVIYFVQNYMNGLVHPWLLARARTFTGDARRQTLDNDRALQSGAEAGCTLLDGGVTISEVHIERCVSSTPADPEATNYEELLSRDVGGMCGNMAFHEAMHNKVDPTQRAGFDLHNGGGGGLAAASISDTTTATTANLRHMARALSRARPQYIRGQTALPSSSP